MKYNFSYKTDFRDNPKIIELEKDCDNFFSNNEKKVGHSKSGDKCIRGFCIHLYDYNEVDFVPVIFYPDKLMHEIDFKKIGIQKEHSQEFEDNLYRRNDPFSSLKKICYIFHNGKNYHEFFFYFSKDRSIREKIHNDINRIFFIEPFKEKLEVDLKLSNNSKKMKI